MIIDIAETRPTAWLYDTATDLDRTLVDRMRAFPRQPDLLASGLRMLAAILIRGWLRAFHQLRIEGRENLPADRSFVMVANHSSHLDALCLLSALRLEKLDHAYPAAAEDYFFRDLGRLALASIVMNALPFDRRSNVARSLMLCRKLLEEPGNVLVIFPEGTRTPTGRMGAFRRGVGLLLAGTDVPVVPCHLSGTYDAWPRGRMLPRPSRVRLAIGTPRTYPALAQRKGGANAVCAHLRTAIEELAPSAPLRKDATEVIYE